LLIVGSHDGQVLELNRRAAAAMIADVELDVITGASHLFAEPGTLEQAADHAAAWFARHLTSAAEPDSGSDS
jgi:alpha-beta hydrolase superfamily lysophospholipase